MMRNLAYDVNADIDGRTTKPPSKLAHDDGDTCVGTATFVVTDVNKQESHTAVTGRHCLLLDGESEYYVDYFYLLLGDGTRCRFEHVGSFPRVDLAVLRSHEVRQGLVLASAHALAFSRSIWMTGFPKAVDDDREEYKGTAHEEPTSTHGQIVGLRNAEFWLGDYVGFPNASGGAVTTRDCRFVGLHLDHIYYEAVSLEGSTDQTVLLADETHSVAVFGKMSAPPASSPTPSKTHDQRLERHSLVMDALTSNISHKGHVSAFLACSTIERLLAELKLVATMAVKPGGSQSGRKRTKR
jgi:hypothetical protein